MTVIVGLEFQNQVYMGCDSGALAGYDIFQSRLHKVFQKGPFLIGYTDSFRMGQLLQYRLQVREQNEGEDDLEYLVVAFVESVRACLQEGGFAKKENEQEEGGQFLVGYRGRLYLVDNDYQVNSCRDGYYAVGCGMGYALGSLHTPCDLIPESRVRRALEAAGHFSGGVSRPFLVVGPDGTSTTL